MTNDRVQQLWERPSKATLDDLYFALIASGEVKDWVRCVFFLWCVQVRFEYERAIFPPKDKSKHGPPRSLFAYIQMLIRSYNPLLYSVPETHKETIARFRTYVPEIEAGYEPPWPHDAGASRSEADAQAKKQVAAMADVSARVLELTAIPEYLESLKVYVAHIGRSEELASFRSANDTMWRIESERQINSGLAVPPRARPNQSPEPTPGSVTPRAEVPRSE